MTYASRTSARRSLAIALMRCETSSPRPVIDIAQIRVPIRSELRDAALSALKT